MASSNSSSGMFLATTQVWDVNEVADVDVTKKSFNELLVRMYQKLNSMAIALNNKESSAYSSLETIKGQSFNASSTATPGNTSNPAPRQTFNKVIDFGALPNIATKSVAHGIVTNIGFSFTRIYACSTKPDAVPANFAAIPIPTTGVTLTVDGTNVNITTTADMHLYTTTYVILEYIKG